MMPLFMPRRKMDVHSALIIALLVGIAGFVPARQTLAQSIAYNVTELSAASDAGQVPCRLNNLGDLVGRANNSAAHGTRATTWSHSTLQPKVLGVLPGGEYSTASAVNDAGAVAGASNTGNSIVPFVWKPTGGLQRIPLLPGDKCGQAFGINKYGHVAGYSSGPNGRRAFLWVRSAGVRNLGVLQIGRASCRERG